MNEVPQELVKRCGIEKMPTIQMYEKREKTWELICGEEGSARVEAAKRRRGGVEEFGIEGEEVMNLLYSLL